MTTPAYLPDLYKVCSVPLEHSQLLSFIDKIELLDVKEYVLHNFPQRYSLKLPSCLRPYIIAIKTMAPMEISKFLKAYKTTLQDPLLSLSDDNVNYMYMLIYVLLFIRLFAFDDYSKLFYKLYSQVLSLFSIV